MGNPRTLTLLPPQKSKRHNWFPFWSFQEAPLNPRRRTEVFTPHTLVFPRGTPFPPRERRRAWLALLAQRHSPAAAVTSASVVLTWSLLVIMHATVGSASSASSSHPAPVHNVKSENDHLVNVLCGTRVWNLLDTSVTAPFLSSPVMASRVPLLQRCTPVVGTIEVCFSSYAWLLACRAQTMRACFPSLSS